jgi:tetratricopeptide (TPR) repeat protein
VASPSPVTGSEDDSGQGHPAYDAPGGGPRLRARRRDGLVALPEREVDNAALIQDAQALLEAFAGRDAAVLLSSVTELCRLLTARGATRRAELLLRQMLPIGEEHLDRDHVALGHVLHELAHVHLREGRYADAEPLLLRLYYMQCRRCGKDHPDAAAVLASLARVRQALGQHDDAEAMWRQVISVCERSLGSQHVATTTAVERLAESCAARGKHGEAGQLRAQATSMRDAPLTRALLAPIDDIAPLRIPEMTQPEPHGAAAPAEAAASRTLVVLPSSSGALTVGEQATVPPTLAASTQDTLLAIHAELQATNGATHSEDGRRSWRAFAAAAGVLALLGGLTASGAASTFGARPNDGVPTWAAWGPPGPPTPARDSAAVATADAVYEVRLAAEVPGRTEAEVTRSLTHARLIGPMPRLPLPNILADRQLGDEVVVRFLVDATGVPDTTSLDVVRTPHDMLTEVVRRALPDLRFEPARRATPGAPGEPDVVEMSFRFSRTVQ